MRVSIFPQRFTMAALATAALLTTGCGEVARTGRAPTYLVIQALEGASGASPSEFGATMSSDVVTLVEQSVNGTTVKVPTLYGDIGRVTFGLGFKDPTATSAPSPLNAVTISRYRVSFRRADGRNTQGVDVPYAFDGAFTVTVPAGSTVSAGFDLVRIAAKAEPPLANLAGRGGAQFIGTIAEISFYGRDQAGNDVSAAGTMSVTFADFGDPK